MYTWKPASSYTFWLFWKFLEFLLPPHWMQMIRENYLSKLHFTETHEPELEVIGIEVTIRLGQQKKYGLLCQLKTFFTNTKAWGQDLSLIFFLFLPTAKLFLSGARQGFRVSLHVLCMLQQQNFWLFSICVLLVLQLSFGCYFWKAKVIDLIGDRFGIVGWICDWLLY